MDTNTIDTTNKNTSTINNNTLFKDISENEILLKATDKMDLRFKKENSDSDSNSTEESFITFEINDQNLTQNQGSNVNSDPTSQSKSMLYKIKIKQDELFSFFEKINNKDINDDFIKNNFSFEQDKGLIFLDITNNNNTIITENEKKTIFENFLKNYLKDLTIEDNEVKFTENNNTKEFSFEFDKEKKLTNVYTVNNDNKNKEIAIINDAYFVREGDKMVHKIEDFLIKIAPNAVINAAIDSKNFVVYRDQKQININDNIIPKETSEKIQKIISTEKEANVEIEITKIKKEISKKPKMANAKETESKPSSVSYNFFSNRNEKKNKFKRRLR